MNVLVWACVMLIGGAGSVVRFLADGAVAYGAVAYGAVAYGAVAYAARHRRAHQRTRPGHQRDHPGDPGRPGG